MIQKIKNYLLLSISTLMMLAPLAVPAVAGATGNNKGKNNDTTNGCDSNIAGQVASGANQASGGDDISCDDAGVGTSDVGTLASGVVNIFSVVVGAVAIIMIIYGGFRYITSGGDSGGVGNAKNTIIYAIVGLIIVALAQIIVHFVLNQTQTAVNG